jgi:uncharacterized protein YcbK (DUF882 family)
MTEVPPQRRLEADTVSFASSTTTTTTSSPLTRRSFFAFAAGACSLLLINKTASAAPQSLLPAKRVFISHPYAGESFRDVYFANGRYIPEAMARIQRLLRDQNDNSLHRIDPQLVDLMNRMQQTLRTDQPLSVVSGYRSPRSNEKARRTDRKVAVNSFHMQGKAVDIRVSGFSLSTLRRAAIGLQAGGVGTYRGRDFLHIDVGPVRAWG